MTPKLSRNYPPSSRMLSNKVNTRLNAGELVDVFSADTGAIALKGILLVLGLVVPYVGFNVFLAPKLTLFGIKLVEESDNDDNIPRAPTM